MRIVWLAGYIATILAANWAIEAFGMVSVGFGLIAPAGVYFAGLAFTLRDGVQEYLGKKWVLVAILVGAGLSAIVSPGLAVASGAAFFLSELLDFAVYTPLRKRGLFPAVLASNLVGAFVDSAVFLFLAFGSLEFLVGQVTGKLWVTLFSLVVLVAIRGYRRTA